MSGRDGKRSWGGGLERAMGYCLFPADIARPIFERTLSNLYAADSNDQAEVERCIVAFKAAFELREGKTRLAEEFVELLIIALGKN